MLIKTLWQEFSITWQDDNNSHMYYNQLWYISLALNLGAGIMDPTGFLTRPPHTNWVPSLVGCSLHPKCRVIMFVHPHQTPSRSAGASRVSAGLPLVCKTSPETLQLRHQDCGVFTREATAHNRLYQLCHVLFTNQLQEKHSPFTPDNHWTFS